MDINLFRELFGVKVCETDEIGLLKNFTNTVMKSKVCPLPCKLNYLELDILPGTVIYKLNIHPLNIYRIIQNYYSSIDSNDFNRR